MVGSEREKVKRGGRRLHIEELHEFHASTCYSEDQIQKDEVDNDVIRMGDKGGSYKFFVGKPEEKNQMENPGLDGGMILK